MSYICKLKRDKSSHALDAGILFENSLEVAERLILEHVTLHYDSQIVEDFKEFFVDVKNALSLGLQGTHRLMYELNDLDIKVYLYDKLLRFVDRSSNSLEIKIVKRYEDCLESE